MIDEREPGDVSQQAFGRRQFSSTHVDAPSLIGAGFIGALLGGSIVWVLRSFRAGDEPPIRVKGGSMHLDVLSGSAVWKKLGSSGKKWILTGGMRGKEDYDVSIVTSSSRCTHKTPSGKNVRVEYTEGKTVRWVDLRAPGKKTMVMDASDPLTLANSGRRLMFAGYGYISKILVDSYVCEFSNATELDHAVLLDF